MSRGRAGLFILNQQDSVGLVTFDQQVRSLIRPSSNPSHMKQLLHVMEQVTPQGKTAAGAVFHDLAERLKKRGIVLVFSDLFDRVPAILAGLEHFRHRHHEVVIFHVLDPAELEFPFQQMTMFKGLEHFPNLLADPIGLRREYLEQFGEFLRSVRDGCREHRIDYVQVRTDRPVDLRCRNICRKDWGPGGCAASE